MFVLGSNEHLRGTEYCIAVVHGQLQNSLTGAIQS